MDIEIRRGEPEDAQAIASVHVRGWQAGYAAFLDAAWLAALSVDEWRQSWDRRLANAERPGPLVAVVDGRIVGFANFGPVPPDHPLPPDYAELYTLYVDPDVYSLGVGAALLAASVEAMRGAGYKRASLWCYEPNEGARRFYERHSWRIDGARRSYDSGPDAVRYVRELGIEPAGD